MSCEIFTLTKIAYIRVLKRAAGRIKIRITNKKITPYNLYNDMMEFKIAVTENNKHLYAPGISGSVYGNFWTDSETFQSIGSFITNSYGIAKVQFPTNSIPRKNINAATFYADIFYKGSIYTSHKCEANYVKYATPIIELCCIIDAAGGYSESMPIDRSLYRVYDAYAVGGSPRINDTIIVRCTDTAPA